MSESALLKPPRQKAVALDRRGWAELTGVFLVFAVLFSLLNIDLVQTLTEDPSYGPTTLLVGIALGTAISVGLCVLSLWIWRRAPGRAAQRKGRHAWRIGRLPDDGLERAQVVADLQRRERVLTASVFPLLLGGIWAVIGLVQVITSDSRLHTLAWILFAACFVALAIRTAVDRRRLPHLRRLLTQAAADRV